MNPDSSEQLVAAVDLGSNSFHMVVGRLVGGRLHLVDRLRERVGLGAGLDSERNLAPDVQRRALECLERFGERLRHLSLGSVGAVGTNTLRRANNAEDFLLQAQEILGHPIEVISGAEEARLIYLGVAHTLADDEGRRLVVDIGGGSTEIILGERFEVLRTSSLQMGCVSYSRRFFPNGRLKKDYFQEAFIAAELELQSIGKPYRKKGWSEAVGASGTVRAVAGILLRNGWASEEEGVTRDGLEKLRKALLDFERFEDIELPGLSDDRRPVIAGGLAVLHAFCEYFKIENLRTSNAALREGLIYDLLGRIQHEDVRDRTIRHFASRFHVDKKHAERVEALCLTSFDKVQSEWKLNDDDRAFLIWAARIHEAGMSLAYAGYHRHGAYFIRNAHMPGFTQEAQAMLAALVRCHRRKIDNSVFEALPEGLRTTALRLAVLLRIAVRFHRSRGSRSAPPRFSLHAKKDHITLGLPADWIETHPLVRADLEREAEYLKAIDVKLEVTKSED